MKRGFLYQLRQDTDMMWKGGMGIMLILLLLCLGVMGLAGEDESVYQADGGVRHSDSRGMDGSIFCDCKERERYAL